MGIREFDVVEITKDVVVKSDGVVITYAPGTRAAVLEVFQPPLRYLIEFVSSDGSDVNQALVGPLDVKLVQ
ncbi:hypothetical protein DEAC_c17130 [Desulfosporosinus acididurans]|uniref:DUF4926 domain-containing protein n=1 Tax=Desulfosporosinus acididurans TaxID=476652 RepID=A0A0J1FS58_9FIRM|nr:hypothetical protein DEAC_c17130 [Desulfosporosinus acididurans]